MMTDAFAGVPTSSGASSEARVEGADRASVPAAREFLSVRVGGQDYGIAAGMVAEIRGCSELAAIEDAPDCVAGALDRRGGMVPVVDLRNWFGLEPIEAGTFNVAVVVELGGRMFGLMVDSVSDVLRFTRRQIQPAADAQSGGTKRCGPKSQYVTGMGMDDERKLVLLDIEKLLLGEGIGMLEIEAQ